MERSIIILMLLLLSCEKHEVNTECESNQTYTISFKNHDLIVSTLVINGTKYDVSKIKGDLFIIPINSEVYVIYKTKYIGENSKIHYKDTISVMKGNPNPCAVYNYYW